MSSTSGNRHMQSPPLDPTVADMAPSVGVLTSYDEQHLVTYLRLLDADTEGADWREVALIVLHIDPAHEPDRARRAWDSHLGASPMDDETAIDTCYAGARHTSRNPVPCRHGNMRCRAEGGRAASLGPV